MSFKSSFGADQDAKASQKKIKSGTTPAGLTVIIWHMPRNAESFSSLSLMLRNEVHLLDLNLQRNTSLVSIWFHLSKWKILRSVKGIIARWLLCRSFDLETIIHHALFCASQRHINAQHRHHDRSIFLQIEISHNIYIYIEITWLWQKLDN